ncbi:TNF receptor-associated factor 4-like [Oopsacas minuta]|uniref:TNF receptor-associated factor 4-like n=1 Tax=Oopsacas minuta TaxID=111878 RepID=A0AAV7JXH0_9METZ|nr:TNF receptor-associated factor 4-like [Oopsacas minuta]
MASKANILPDDTSELLFVKRSKVGVVHYCGYRREILLQNLNSVEEEFLMCKICLGVMRDAVSCRDGETSCSVCCTSPLQSHSVNTVQISISKLIVKCPLFRDCSWNGKFSEVREHLEICEFFRVECSKCKEIFERQETDKHNNIICPMREIECVYCSKMQIFLEMDKHLNVCREFPILCPNTCGKKFPRIQLFHHKEDCPLEFIKCPFADFGCMVDPMQRQFLTEHKKYFTSEHIDMTLAVLSQQNQDIKSLKRERIELNMQMRAMKQLDGVDWEIKEVKKQTDGYTEQSPVFKINKISCHIHLSYHAGYINFSLKRNGVENINKYPGEPIITRYIAVVVDKLDFTNSSWEERSMDFNLKASRESGIFHKMHCYKYHKFITPEESLFLTFYFDFDSLIPLKKTKSIRRYIPISPSRNSLV